MGKKNDDNSCKMTADNLHNPVCLDAKHSQITRLRDEDQPRNNTEH